MKNQKGIIIAVGLGVLALTAYRKVEGIMFQKYYLMAQDDEIKKYREFM